MCASESWNFLNLTSIQAAYEDISMTLCEQGLKLTKRLPK